MSCYEVALKDPQQWILDSGQPCLYCQCDVLKRRDGGLSLPLLNPVCVPNLVHLCSHWGARLMPQCQLSTTMLVKTSVNPNTGVVLIYLQVLATSRICPFFIIYTSFYMFGIKVFVEIFLTFKKLTMHPYFFYYLWPSLFFSSFLKQRVSQSTYSSILLED